MITHHQINKFLKNFRVTSLLVVLVFTGIIMFSSCKKDKKYDAIPYAYVNIFLDPNGTMYQNLNNVGGYEYLTADEPSRGIIVYRVSMDEFRAYERTCPYDPLADCSRIQVEPSGITCIDSCCMSRLSCSTDLRSPVRLPYP